MFSYVFPMVCRPWGFSLHGFADGFCWRNGWILGHPNTFLCFGVLGIFGGSKDPNTAGVWMSREWIRTKRMGSFRLWLLLSIHESIHASNSSSFVDLFQGFLQLFCRNSEGVYFDQILELLVFQTGKVIPGKHLYTCMCHIYIYMYLYIFA